MTAASSARRAKTTWLPLPDGFTTSTAPVLRCHAARISYRPTPARRTSMAITLNHTIVPTRDKEAAARFFAEIFDLRFDGASGHFAPVRVNDTLTLDFADA